MPAAQSQADDPIRQCLLGHVYMTTPKLEAKAEAAVYASVWSALGFEPKKAPASNAMESAEALVAACEQQLRHSFSLLCPMPQA